MAWLTGWAKRIEITVSNTNIASDLTHFPLLVKLGTSVGTGADDVSAIFDELTSDANRFKIAVTDDTGDTEIKVEIAEWDDASETAVLWVSSSGLTLSASATTTLYIYYDAGHADNTANVGDIGSTPGEAVWDSNFVYVHHGVTASPVDSTGGDNDGTSTGSTTIAGPSGMGTAMDFDGSASEVATPWPSSPPTAGHTIELWIDPDTVPLDCPISAWGSGAGMNFGIWIDNDWYTGGGSWVNLDSGMTAAGWQQLAMAHPSGTGAMEVWRNGVSLGTTGSYATTWATPTSGDITYGIDQRTDVEDWAGGICEVRLSDIQRTDAYMLANYHSTNDNLVSYGSEETDSGDKTADGAPDIILVTAAGVAVQSSPPIITVVDGDDAWTDGDSALVATGTGFA